MAHRILIDDIAEAMKTEIVLASSVSAEGTKHLKFRPWDLTYLVRYSGVANKSVAEDYSNVLDAIGKYNSLNV